MEGLVLVGCIVILVAAFVLACAMNIQQFALSGDRDHWVFKYVGCCGKRVSPRNLLWFVGLMVYLVAQLLVLASLAITPFALVSTLYATVLVFDDLIAYFILGKRFNTFEIGGIFVIVGSLGVSAFYSPNIEYDLYPNFAPSVGNVTAKASLSSGPWALETILETGSASNTTNSSLTNYIVMEKAVSETSSGIVLGTLVVIIVGGWLLVRHFESLYPDFPQGKEEVPKFVYRTMQIIYPAILGTIETFGAASLKALGGMIAGAGVTSLSAGIFWGVLCCWVLAIANTVLWLRYVYSKFPTSECLPVEIALTAVFSVYVGLYVYQEKEYASNQSVQIMFCCSVGILSGIALIVAGGAKRDAKVADLERKAEQLEKDLEDGCHGEVFDAFGNAAEEVDPGDIGVTLEDDPSADSLVTVETPPGSFRAGSFRAGSCRVGSFRVGSFRASGSEVPSQGGSFRHSRSRRVSMIATRRAGIVKIKTPKESPSKYKQGNISRRLSKEGSFTMPPETPPSAKSPILNEDVEMALAQ